MTADEEYDQWLARLRRDEILATYQHRVFEAELAPEHYKPGGYGHFPRPESLASDRKPPRRRPYEFTARQLEIAQAALKDRPVVVRALERRTK